MTESNHTKITNAVEIVLYILCICAEKPIVNGANNSSTCLNKHVVVTR